MIKLPEPAMKLHGKKNGKLTAESMDYYNKEQVLQAVRDALEEAAKLCCTLHSNDQTNILYAAKAIRKMKDET